MKVICTEQDEKEKQGEVAVNYEAIDIYVHHHISFRQYLQKIQTHSLFRTICEKTHMKSVDQTKYIQIDNSSWIQSLLGGNSSFPEMKQPDFKFRLFLL